MLFVQQSEAEHVGMDLLQTGSGHSPQFVVLQPFEIVPQSDAEHVGAPTPLHGSFFGLPHPTSHAAALTIVNHQMFVLS